MTDTGGEQAKPLLLPAKCPESGRRVAPSSPNGLSGGLGIRTRHVARAISTSLRYSSIDPLLFSAWSFRVTTVIDRSLPFPSGAAVRSILVSREWGSQPGSQSGRGLAWETAGRNRACVYYALLRGRPAGREPARGRPMGGGKVCAVVCAGRGRRRPGGGCNWNRWSDGRARRAVAVTGARCAGGFPRKGRRGGAPRLSPCGGRVGSTRLSSGGAPSS